MTVNVILYFFFMSVNTLLLFFFDFFHFFLSFFEEMGGMVCTPQLYMMGESETEVVIVWIEDRFCR